MKILEWIFLVTGVVLFAGLVYHIGYDALQRDLSLVGAGFVLVFGQELLAILFNTLGWHYAIRSPQRSVALADLFAMRLAGDAVNYVTPSASIGGELVKARLLQRRISTSEAVGSVSVSAVNQFLSQMIFILVGIPLFAGGVLTPELAHLTFGVCGLFVLACAALFYLGWRQNLFQRVRAVLVKLGWFSRWTKNGEAWRELDEDIFGSFRHYPFDNALSVLLFTLGWGMGAVEVYLILYFLQIPVGWETAAAIEGLSVLIDMSFFYVPAKIGTQEGGKYFIFLLLGLNPASGFALGVVRRLREIGWTLLGLLAFGYYQYGKLLPTGWERARWPERGKPRFFNGLEKPEPEGGRGTSEDNLVLGSLGLCRKGTLKYNQVGYP